MMKNLLFLGIGIVLIGGLWYWRVNQLEKSSETAQPEMTAAPITYDDSEMMTPASIPMGTSPLDASYLLDDQMVTLVNGTTSFPAAPGSASMVTVSVFGEPTMGDLNGDGVSDAAVLMTAEMGGSGTFFYQAAALNVNGGYQGTNAVLLGDSIAPQTTQITDQTIIANYAVRAESDPMTAQPSMAMSMYLQVLDGILTEVAQPN